MTQDSSCIVCRNEKYRPLYENLLRRCQVCGFVTASVDAAKVDFDDIYGHQYFNGEEYLDYALDKHVIQTNFRQRLDRAFRFKPPSKMMSVLELGCAYGFFGEVLREFAVENSYVGYDIASDAVVHASATLGLDARCMDYLDSREIPGQFTDCFMWDVIEHLVQPDKVIQRIYADLQPGGHLYITTGDMERFLPRLQGRRWRMIHPPTHLHYFSRRTLSQMLERDGFEVCDVTYPSISRSIRLVFYSLFMLRKNPSRLVRALHRIIPENLSISLNTGDIMFLIAKRK